MTKIRQYSAKNALSLDTLDMNVKKKTFSNSVLAATFLDIMNQTAKLEYFYVKIVGCMDMLKKIVISLEKQNFLSKTVRQSQKMKSA